jgi:hypothetical protein
MSFVARRAAYNELLCRIARARTTLAAIEALRVEFNPGHAKLAAITLASNFGEDGDFNEERAEEVGALVGLEVLVLSEEFLAAISEDATVVRNARHYIEGMRKLLATEGSPDLNDREPSLDGWSDPEVEAAAERLKRRAEKLARTLDEVRASLSRLLDQRIHERGEGSLFTSGRPRRIPFLGDENLSRHVGAPLRAELARLFEGLRHDVAPRPVGEARGPAGDRIELHLPPIVLPSGAIVA